MKNNQPLYCPMAFDESIVTGILHFEEFFFYDENPN
jgi:hypothetical protein